MLENKMEQTIAQDELHEECGVFGIYDLDGQDVASTIYMACSPCSTVDRRAAVSQSARHRDRKVKYPVLRIWGLSMKYLMQRNWSV